MTDTTPPADRAALRDRIAAVIWERQNPGRCWADCEYRWRADAEADADAVLAVLPASVDRATVLREAATIVRSMDSDYALQEAAEHLDGLAVEADEEREAQAHLDALAPLAEGAPPPDLDGAALYEKLTAMFSGPLPWPSETRPGTLTAQLIALVRDFLDPDPCRLDHHGYCQAHSWLCGGSRCPHARAREVLAAIDSEPAAVLRRVADETPQPETERTPCSDPPCDDGPGEPCDRHETEQAHADGLHEDCGVTCGVQFPSEQMRNFVVAKGYPGTAGMLDELLRRAASGQLPAVGAQQPKEADGTAADALLASRCDACRHTLKRHTNHGACTVVLCVCGTFQPPADEPQPKEA